MSKKTYPKQALQSFPLLWAGNDETFYTFLASLRDAQGYSTNGVPAEQEPLQSRLLSIADGVGIVSIQGTLTNHDAWYNEHLGLVSYPEIVEALHQALLDPGIHEILIDMGSGGGAVDGVLDAVSAIAQANKIKRVTAFSSSVAASAGFWAIAPARERYLTATAIVGSIGVVMRHVEFSKMAEMEGVTETIIRSGEYKQIANNAEALTNKAEGVLQGMVDYTNQIFEENVAEHLGVSAQLVSAKMGQGREFIGQQAVDAGLFTGVASFETVFAKIRRRIAKSNNSNGGIDMKKKYGMAAALAATSAGVDLSAGVEGAPGLTPEQIEVAADVQAALEEKITADVAALLAVQGEGGDTEALGEGEQASDEVRADAGVVELLKAQLKDKDDELFSAKMAAKGQEAELAGLVTLKGIVAASINNMSVALGGTKDEALSTKDVASLAALHETMLTRTVESFKVGGLAQHEAGEAPAEPKVSRLDAALSSAAAITQPKK